MGQELRGVGGLHSLSNHCNHCLISKAPYTVVKYVDVLMGLHLCEGEGGGSDVDTNVAKSEGATDVRGDSDEETDVWGDSGENTGVRPHAHTKFSQHCVTLHI